MPFAQSLALLSAFGLVMLLPVLSSEPDTGRSDGELFEVNLADGSQVKIKLLD